MSRILFISGSSGGHLTPLLAVAEELKKMNASTEIRFLCSPRGEDQDMLTRRGFTFTVLPALCRSSGFPLAFWKNISVAREILRTFRPDIIFSKGGAAGIPLCSLAHKKNIPVILHESDAVMGRANVVASRWADVMCLGFLQEKDSGQRTADFGRTIKFPNPSVRSPKSEVLVTGNPVRPEILTGSREEGLRITGFDGTKPILIILGGSQGAEVLNRIVMNALPPLLAVCDVIHLTGKGKTGAPLQRGYWARPFVDRELPHLYACASLALSRAGASTLSEFAATGLPAILVPLRGLAQDHQMKNAECAEKTGGCILVQQEMLPQTLLPLVTDLLQNEDRRAEMAVKIRQIGGTGAARHVAEIIVENLASAGSDA
ncbi:UDP-N-acetylglucosamine--N-acetylmuramyl-(pentapeptide) pyrophosphoryl-undecaprenol N-acetylglucosamine transferase [Candidatus Peregrinibacteria bacterium]|nr:UDP-N-acetylglucosamine--N-acetylmuramyl-(pentapeptide) pyrophosphoryl-undecaprenol N-acetylglucosamine transferase [Candidatus Peregrinibacteria bacterium]